MLLLLSAVFVLFATCFFKFVFSYWTRKGFPAYTPTIPIGCLGPVLRQKRSLGELLCDLHLKLKVPFVGLYFFHRPTLLIRDPQLVKRVLINDFEYFTDRGMFYDEENDPVGCILFSMPGQKWKDLRAKLTPTFSSGKLKSMFQTVEEKTSGIFLDYLMRWTETEDHVELKTVLIKNNINITASTIFGFELDSFEKREDPFVKIGDIFMDPNHLRNNLVMFIFLSAPSVLKWLKIPFLSPDVSEYILNTVRSVVEARKRDPSLIRNDFIQTIIELMEEKGNETVKLSIEMCAAQAFLFYIAGYETSASTTSFCIYELCKNPVWMERARKEVDEVMGRRNGRVTYDDMAELKVLDICINETLRMYPAIPILNRQCTKDYNIPDTDLIVTKGTAVVISTYGLHNDSEYYPNPERFDPTRFERDTGKDLPFYALGGGPRYCIGARLGMIIVKTALCSLIYNFEFEAIDKELEFLHVGLVLSDKNNIRLKIKRRSH